MSKELKVLKEIVNYAIGKFVDSESKYQKDLEIIEKELKALEIIKKKGVNVGLLKRCCDYEEYIWKIHVQVSLKYSHEITEEEYDLLKEVLK